MENRMNKEQVIEATINLLGEISVPVRLKEQISDPISGAIMNLAIVLQMIQAENAANKQRTAEHGAAIQEETGDQEEGEPVKEPISLFGEEAEENGREADPFQPSEQPEEHRRHHHETGRGGDGF